MTVDVEWTLQIEAQVHGNRALIAEIDVVVEVEPHGMTLRAVMVDGIDGNGSVRITSGTKRLDPMSEAIWDTAERALERPNSTLSDEVVHAARDVGIPLRVERYLPIVL